MTRSPEPSSSNSKQSPPSMTPRSRTGKMIQGLLGRFGKKQPEAAPTTPDFLTRAVSSIETDELPTTSIVNDDEDTNWDDEEAPEMDSQPPIPSPITPAPPPPTPAPAPAQDANEDWDDALPAPSVKSETITTVRRVQKEPQPTSEDWWESIPTATTPVPGSLPPVTTSESRFEQAIGLWTAMLQQLRRILPTPLKGLSDAILTAIVVMLVTVGIWTVDGWFTPAPAPSIAVREEPANLPSQTTGATATTPPQISPEQAFIQAIQTQIGEITSKYPDDIIQTLQIDLPHNRLIVRLNNVWYLISDGKQNEVTDRMWLEAQANRFAKLDLQAPNGELIARSPVVGKHMVILQRRVKPVSS